MEKCPLMGKCGSCQLLNLDYDKTIEYKKNYVIDCFKKEGINIHIDKIIKAENPLHYRNKMILSFSFKNGKAISGFYEEESHKVIDLDYCMMHSKLQNEIAKEIKNIVNDFHIRIYDEDKKVGFLRYVLIREAVKTKEILITFVVASEIFTYRNEIVKRLTNKFKEIKTIVQNINTRKTSIVLGEKEQVIYGKGYITDILMGLKFKITSKSFYQVNPIQCEKLYTEVKNSINFKGNELLIDAYSGIGTIGLILSDKVKEVVSIENNSQAVKAAIMNAKDNNIKNIYFENSDATEFITNIDPTSNVDYVVMDPPRTGSTIEFLKSLIDLKPKSIIYVSCGPDTLARDIKVLKDKYEIKRITLVDMFCFTKHVETVVCLTRK